MNKCPKIGDRVKTKPTHRYGELTCTVMAIYPTHNDEFDEDGEFVRFGNGPTPEREWSVGVKVDVLPPNWSYIGTDRFAPQVSDLVRV